MKQEFLQKNADYYNAAAYKSSFDGQTLEDINNWVKSRTDGMIDKILDEIDEDTVMYLINAIVFDAQWKERYKKSDITKGVFNAIGGSKQEVDFMKSKEAKYLDDGKATGFIKPYAEHFSFVALLPNEGISLDEYIEQLTGEQFMYTVKKAENNSIYALIPKFSYEYEKTLNDTLKELGMPDAFSENQADFSKLGEGRLYIGDVLHKTFISVDEQDTKVRYNLSWCMNIIIHNTVLVISCESNLDLTPFFQWFPR